MWNEQAVDLIIKRRLALGLSPADAAQRAGVSQDCWEKWERLEAAHEWNWEAFERAAQALGAKVEIALTDEATAFQTAFQKSGMVRERRLVSLVKDLTQELAILSQPVEPSEN